MRHLSRAGKKRDVDVGNLALNCGSVADDTDPQGQQYGVELPPDEKAPLIGFEPKSRHFVGFANVGIFEGDQ